MKSIKLNFDNAKDSIEAYARQTNMSDFMKRWAFIDYKFITANFLMDYDNSEANKWDIFTDPVFDVFNEDNFQTMYFQYHLGVCMKALIQSEIEIKRLFSDKKNIPAIQLTIEKLFEKAPYGIVRDVMLFDFLKEQLKEDIQLYDAIPEIKTAFSQAYFSDELKKFIETNKSSQRTQVLSEEEKLLKGILHMTNNEIEKLPDVKLLNFLSEKYKNKVLYIDVWATWCAPCIKEFEFTPILHTHFKDKDVVFINLCLESKIENWKAAITKNKISGENYFLNTNESILFRAENNLSGFPSYLIIDRNRKIHNPAPNPSNSESTIKKIELGLK